MQDLYNNLPISKFYTRDIDTVMPDTPTNEAIMLLGKNCHHVILIVDKSGKLKGIITPSDLKRIKGARTAADLGTSKVFAIRSNAKLGHLKVLMMGKANGRAKGVSVSTVPVVDNNDRVLGLATRELVEMKLRNYMC